MNPSNPTFFKQELRIPNLPIILSLIIVGIAIGLIGGRPQLVGQTIPIAIAFLVLAFSAWILNSWHPGIAGKYLILGLAAIIIIMDYWMRVPEAVTMLVVPPVLAINLAGRKFAAGLGILETLAITILWRTGFLKADLPLIISVTLAIWIIFIIVVSTDNRMQHVIKWSWNNYQQSMELLRQTRAHRAELMQTTKDLVHATQQLALMNEKLAIARHVAEEAQKVKATFVANVSHEFRTPLNMIIGLTDLLIENPDVYGTNLPPALLEDIAIVQRNCEHLSSLINDVLDLSQVEAGRMAVRKERFDVLEIIDNAVEIVKPLLDKKGLFIDVNSRDDLPEVYSDRNRVRQIIVNLLSNAARFTEIGGVTVDLWTENTDLSVRVTDTGPGISPEDQKRLFQPFSQGTHKTGLYSIPGSGLGLAICKQFIELLGGKMWVESRLNEGSSFYFRLPVDPPIESAIHPRSKIVEDWIWTERLEPTKIPLEPVERPVVLCDPTGDLHPYLSRYLHEVKIIETREIDEAIVECRTNQANILIVNSPSQQKLANLTSKACRELPELLVLGYCFPPRNENALSAGAIGYILKPVTKALLENKLKSLGRPIYSILLVDDHGDELELLRRMLSGIDKHLQVETAVSGQETLDKLRQGSYDLVMLDIVMPDMDGWQVLDMKNQDPAIKDVPTIILSGKDPSDTPLTSKLILAKKGNGLGLGETILGFQALSRVLLERG